MGATDADDLADSLIQAGEGMGMQFKAFPWQIIGMLGISRASCTTTRFVRTIYQVTMLGRELPLPQEFTVKDVSFDFVYSLPNYNLRVISQTSKKTTVAVDSLPPPPPNPN